MKKKLILIVAICSIFALSSFGAIKSLSVSASEVVMEHELYAEYEIGEEIEIPNCTVNVGGKDYTITPVVYLPNGKGTTKNKIELDQRGEYTVDYLKEIDGKTYKKTVKFKVITPLVSFKSDESSYSYGTARESLLPGIASYEAVLVNPQGLNVTLHKDDVASFNQIIDLSKVGNDDTLLEFYFMPNQIGKKDVSAFYITFTDVFDASNQMTVYYKLNRTDGYTYVVAKAGNQPYTGLDAKYDGGGFSGYVVRTNDPYGAVINLYPQGIESKNANQRIALIYDDNEKILYHTGKGYNSYIVDFDDPSIQSALWEGFSSNYVLMSIRADGYESDSMSFFIKKAGDIDLSKDLVLDNDVPEITINSGNVDVMDMPNGKVGLPYKVFDATASDLYSFGNVRVQRRVFFDYKRESGEYNSKSNSFIYEMNIEDGRFIPNHKGKYSIVYSAVDHDGNYVEKVLTVNVFDDTLDESVLTLKDSVKAVEVGNLVRLADVDECYGYKGDKEIRYSVYFNEELQEIQGNELKGYTFIPSRVGTYKVKVELIDTVGGGKTVEYDLVVSDSTTPAISEGVYLPKYFAREFTYELPELYAIDYANGMNRVKASVKIIDGLGERDYLGGRVSFSADKNGVATIRYYVGNNSLDYQVKVVSVRKGLDANLSGYFYKVDGDLEVVADRKGIALTSKSGDGTVEFIHELIANKFIANLMIDSSKNAFDTLNITLTDSQDYTKQVVVSFKKEVGKAGLYLNGEYTGKDCGDIFNKGTINLYYNESTNSLTDGGTINVKLSKTAYGESFSGFTSGRVYVSFGLTGITARSTVYVMKINNQNLNDTIYEDKVKPEYSLSGMYSNLQIGPNETITVFPAVYDDVLSNIVEASVTVSYNDAPVSDVNGKILRKVSCDRSYEVSAKFYGDYIIKYNIVDASGRVQGYSYMISVVDKEGPTITTSMKGGNYKLGSIISVASATAYDNIDGDVKVYTYLLCPNYAVEVVKDGSFKAREVGVYTVRYVAFDSNGNTSYKDFEITVGGNK